MCYDDSASVYAEDRRLQIAQWQSSRIHNAVSHNMLSSSMTQELRRHNVLLVRPESFRGRTGVTRRVLGEHQHLLCTHLEVTNFVKWSQYLRPNLGLSLSVGRAARAAHSDDKLRVRTRALSAHWATRADADSGVRRLTDANLAHCPPAADPLDSAGPRWT
ncbi:hypothetical protein B5X24_HaOG215521 [Helicoverpa armigera]|nr:hypothetical protein B5X24_HaOG215521 [Helicoverpa armigera]